MDRDDFAARVTAAEPTLYHISKSILKNDCDCADAVQEAIVTAYGKLLSLRDERYFKTWLCRILIHECYRIYRANRKVVPLEETLQTELPSEQSGDPGLFAAIMTLREELRLVIVLHYVEGFQVSEIAGMLKIPEGTVKSRLSRARAELRLALEEKEVLVHEL
ncbi:RNA polymerase ECF subfamily sigma factor [Oscillibacter valericigenes Sjm18-20]|nr:RNA polymerase ECF subfamily sigma factor [Oscillibacter valericigenes Sjm18-20]